MTDASIWRWLRGVLAPPPLRPPGARRESEFVALCTRCYRCIVVCSYKSLKPAGWKHGAAGGTPLCAPQEAPCFLCMLCPPACPTGALEPVSDKRLVRMGRAEVDRKTCYAFQGILCRTCVDDCPLPEAITQDAELHPQVTDRCVGCGICEKVCPAPAVAIRVRPRGDRNT
ncbi:MAG: 4Fe-4S dicluster domain-containing protein [Terriglobales bacterium]